MSRTLANKYNPKFSIVLSSHLAYFVRRHAFEEGLIVSEMFEKAMAEWLVAHKFAESYEQIENTYAMEK